MLKGNLDTHFDCIPMRRAVFAYSYVNSPIMIEGMHSVLDTVTKWALNNKVKQVTVLDGIAVESMPNLKRTPMIMSSDGESCG